MNNYLLTLLVKNDVEEKDRQALLEDVKKNFGQMEKEDVWGKRDLSYPIDHQTSAFYVHFQFQSEPKTISQLDKFLKLNEDIIRYLLVRSKGKKKDEEKKEG